MQLTRLNFAQSLPFIKSTIAKAHFLAFDLEMSGILSNDLSNPSIADSYLCQQQMQMRYEKQKQSIKRYIPLQFGLSAFNVDLATSKITASPFNFFIFPLPVDNDPLQFTFHPATLHFLAKHGFDFNRLIYQGIPYTNQDRINLFRKENKLLQLKKQLRKTKLLQSPESKAFEAQHLPTILQWINSESQDIEINIQFMKYSAYKNFEEKLRELYPQKNLQFTYDEQVTIRRTKMLIKKVTRDESHADMKISLEQEQTLWFNQLLDDIVALKKPLIVHNGFLDLMHIYYRCFRELPHLWSDYKEQVHRLFPYIYDNKYLYANSPILFSKTEGKSTSLESCYLGIRKQQDNSRIQIGIDANCGQYSWDSLDSHEAGFDALMTGYSFLNGVTTLNSDLNLLTNPQAFASTHKFIRNRIPQGSIKTPFNFEAPAEDIYTKDGNKPFYFKSLLHKQIDEKTVQKHFETQYGPITFLWTQKGMVEFCVIFSAAADQQSFLQNLKNRGAVNSVIVEIEEIKFIVLDREEHNQLMRNMFEEESQSTEKETKSDSTQRI